MTFYYDLSNELFSQSRSQTVDPKMWFVSWDFEGCWNCGGSFLVERRTPAGFFQYQRCAVCNGSGILLYSQITYGFDPAWLTPPNSLPLRILNGESNEWYLSTNPP